MAPPGLGGVRREFDKGQRVKKKNPTAADWISDPSSNSPTLSLTSTVPFFVLENAQLANVRHREPVSGEEKKASEEREASEQDAQITELSSQAFGHRLVAHRL